MATHLITVFFLTVTFFWVCQLKRYVVPLAAGVATDAVRVAGGGFHEAEGEARSFGKVSPQESASGSSHFKSIRRPARSAHLEMR
jgi:hypothetical protein